MVEILKQCSQNHNVLTLIAIKAWLYIRMMRLNLALKVKTVVDTSNVDILAQKSIYANVGPPCNAKVPMVAQSAVEQLWCQLWDSSRRGSV